MSRSSGTPGIAYQPSLDGLRAVAVVMVLLFHGEVGWMRGGYFGVSMFFTLSGFLITSLMVSEFDHTGRVDPRAFYARRLRRLMPASLVCLSVVCILGAFDQWQGVDHLRRDTLGALFQVANWVQLGAGESYTDLQSRNAGIISPLDHYWSLAIEEQFYWVWPFAFWGLARVALRRGWRLSSVLGALTAAFAVAAPVIAAVWGRDAAYWATPARAAEIVIGAWLAATLAAGRVRPQAWMAPAAAVAALAVAVLLPAAGGPAYHGAFPVLAVVTALLLLGLQRPGPVATVLASAPLVALGKISYGVYLYHFPAFVLMSPQRVGQTGTVLLVLRVAVTLAVATLSYVAVERPIRFGRTSAGRTTFRSAVATLAVCGLVLLVPAGGQVYYAPDADLVEAAAIQPVESPPPLSVATTVAPLSPSTAPPTDAPVDEPVDAPVDEPVDELVEEPALSRPARILVVGDSTAEATGAGMVAWAAEHPELAQVTLTVEAGCGFVRGGTVPLDDGMPFTELCDELLDGQLPDDLNRLQPDVVVMMVTSRDIVPRQWDADEGVLDPRDPRYVDRIRAGYRAVSDLIVAASEARIVWIRAPKIDGYWLGEPSPFTDPLMVQIRENVMRETIEQYADRSQLLDLRGWMEATGLADDHDARPDGLHFTVDAAHDLATQWLGPQLLVAAAENAAHQAARGPAD